ncbi:MAG TPA: ferritin-like domain-containing protein [Solirubrobacteraceae bacterium]|jgi:rubrerythrin
MTDPTTDRPGAVAALRSDPASRKRFLRMGGAGLAGALALTLSACGSEEEKSPAEGTDVAAAAAGVSAEVSKADPALRRFGEGDLAIANYALTLEFVETAFYEKALDSGVLTGSAQELFKRFGEQERTHVEALTKLIRSSGGTPVEPPKTKFTFDDSAATLDLAATFEDLGANAYLGQAAKIQSPEILATALSIHSVEARHAAALLGITGKPAAPRAFAEPADAGTVLAAVQPYLVAQES